MEGYLVRSIYVDEGATMQVMFEHCFNNLSPSIRAHLTETQTNLVGFLGEELTPTGQDRIRGVVKNRWFVPKDFVEVHRCTGSINVQCQPVLLGSNGHYKKTILQEVQDPASRPSKKQSRSCSAKKKSIGIREKSCGGQAGGIMAQGRKYPTGEMPNIDFISSVSEKGRWRVADVH
ncbi:hypothetical protein Tco_1078819 [Tanacetum coccineum]|uniref:Uncharacterized protein n=1 Tax=Tanacetum coccineum TaxID=301880 RepID=A0ABQ5HQZ3_9ASTR